MSECTHDCSSCGQSCSSRTEERTDFHEKPHELSSIKKVIGVVSGKGGVGKSMTSAMLAVLLNRRGYKTAVLDAEDVYKRQTRPACRMASSVGRPLVFCGSPSSE